MRLVSLIFSITTKSSIYHSEACDTAFPSSQDLAKISNFLQFASSTNRISLNSAKAFYLEILPAATQESDVDEITYSYLLTASWLG